MNDYETRVIRGAWDWFEDMTYIKDVRIRGESLAVSFRDPQSGEARTLSLDIYEPAFNNSGHDEPEAVGRLIAIHVEEEAGAIRD
jgi:hypothetical protein